MTVNLKRLASTAAVPALDEVLAAPTIVEVAVAPDGSAVAYVVHKRDPQADRETTLIHIVSTTQRLRQRGFFSSR